MKTVKEIQSEIDANLKRQSELNNQLSKKDNDDHIKELKQLRKNYDYLKMCLDYLKTSPTQDFLNKEHDRLSNRIDLITKNFTGKLEHYSEERFFRKAKSDYEKVMDLPKVKTQLKTIKFLLSQ